MTTYDGNQCVTLMELTWPSTVMFKEISLLGQRLDNLVRLLGDAGIAIRTTPDPDVAYVKGIPLTLYVPNGVVEGVGLGIDE